MSQQKLWNYLVHLRLHFQLLLAPIFMWGFFLAGGTPGRDFWLAFVAFHVFLYGGTTSYNSYYDRDEGPVGGLAHPPAVEGGLLPFSLIVQGIGALVAALVSLWFLLTYAAIFLLATAYSHPRTRLKGRPLSGLFVVGLGQGTLAALGGWFAARPHIASIHALGWMGIAAVTLVTLGFYPITQIYQIESDKARGDLTFAAWLGPLRTFTFSVLVQTLAAVNLVVVVHALVGLVQACLVGVFYVVLLAATARWAAQYEPRRTMANFRTVMRMNAVTSTGFGLFIAAHLFFSG
jgi:1,4-dihydroxy-2-naphthoate octaprenyltransferase